MEDLNLRMKKAVAKIADCWSSHRDRRMFKLLKNAIKTADQTLTHDIIRMIDPKEAKIINDSVFKARIRFRFAGEEFPPFIVFKVFIKTNGQGIRYLSGKKTISPASKAALDSCRLMGSRVFLDQMISDLCEENCTSISSEDDVTNLKAYMKYSATHDERSAKSGGKANTWRKLTLEVVPRDHVIYDVLALFPNKNECIVDYRRVPTHESQVEVIKALSRNLSKKTETCRRSKQAITRAQAMKKIYSDKNELSDAKAKSFQEYSTNNDMIDFNEEAWNKEGELLFEWTQNLSPDSL